MEEFQKEGHTIIFVSHSLPTVQKLCDRALWLDHGRAQAIGAAPQVVEDYLEAVEGVGA
jgi:ABC-2 type transport system ATP-binding protein/lipopolysaccharide transport system ATP-binding protein